jgi:glycosyltransferase involved in cell wall biosynthesis
MEKPAKRLVIVATHPIQHFVSLYRALDAEADLSLQVVFCSKIGLTQYFDRDMNVHIRWNMDLTSGFSHRFLPEADTIGSTAFFAMNNSSVGSVLHDLKPDALIVYGYSPLSALRAILWARLRGIPIMLISDSELLHERSFAINLAKNIILRLFTTLISAFLTVGDNNERYWERYGASRARMFRVPFTIDEPAFLSARSSRDELRKKWRLEHEIAEEEVVFLAVGKLMPRKRQADLIAALIEISKVGKAKIRVVLAGDGPDRVALSSVARENALPVTFLGFVNVDKLQEVYAAADVVILPSEKDAHPLIFSEAACMGLPIVTSDRVGAVGPTDIAQPGVNAVIYPVGDIHSLATIMLDLANDAERRAVMSQASLQVFGTQNISASVSGIKRAFEVVARRSVSPAA